MKVTTAVIMAAGWGSRMLPVTSAVQKELLPILDRPVIDYLVADLVAAGIKQIIFVITPGSHGLQDYYVGNPPLEAHLQRYRKQEAIAGLAKIHHQATFTFVEQPNDVGYGTAIPMLIAEPHLPADEAFVACYGDAFLWNGDGNSAMAGPLIETYRDSGANAAMIGFEKPVEELHRYGVLHIEKKGDYEYLDGFVEKPPLGQEPSNLINFGMFVLEPGFMPFVHAVEYNETGERYVTDALLASAKERPMAVHRATGQFLDSGNLPSWLEANLVMARSRPELAGKLEALTSALTQ